MAMECLAEFPQTPIDHRPRKRPRWDVQPQAQIGMSCGQEVGLGDLESLLSSVAPSDYTCSSTTLFSNKTAWNASPPWREDDKDGHYVFAVGENLTRRYKIYRKMGEGTFGQVLECWDRESKEMVAIKIVRGGNKYREAAMIEIDVLQQLKKHDNAISRCVQLRNWFGYHNHICINVVMQHVDHSAGDLIDLLKGLLNYDPSKRLTAREALRHHFFSRNHRRL